MTRGNVALVLGALLVTGCAVLSSPSDPAPERPETTFESLYALAEAGDPASQNLVGFLLFFGEVAPFSRPIARHWFQRAAEQGSVSAQLNLAIMSYLGAAGAADREAAESHFRRAQLTQAGAPSGERQPSIPPSLDALVAEACAESDVQVTTGERTFVTFCAGCHGLNGISAYPGAPSFALGERMDRSDDELFTTIVRGHEVMPGWGDKLSNELLASALDFSRTLEAELRWGVLHQLREAPESYYRFGPMIWNDAGYRPDGVQEYEQNFESLDALCP